MRSSAYGPITQSKFLGALGINFRLEALLQNATEEQAEALQVGYWRLVGDGPAPWLEADDDPNSDPPGMGARYKVLAVVNSDYAAPIGFEWTFKWNKWQIKYACNPRIILFVELELLV